MAERSALRAAFSVTAHAVRHSTTTCPAARACFPRQRRTRSRARSSDNRRASAEAQKRWSGRVGSDATPGRPVRCEAMTELKPSRDAAGFVSPRSPACCLGCGRVRRHDAVHTAAGPRRGLGPGGGPAFTRARALALARPVSQLARPRGPGALRSLAEATRRGLGGRRIRSGLSDPGACSAPDATSASLLLNFEAVFTVVLAGADPPRSHWATGCAGPGCHGARRRSARRRLWQWQLRLWAGCRRGAVGDLGAGPSTTPSLGRSRT